VSAETLSLALNCEYRDPEYTETSFCLFRVVLSENTLQVLVPIVKAVQLTATRTVIYRKKAVLYGTR
jgi:hypothetical protein